MMPAQECNIQKDHESILSSSFEPGPNHVVCMRGSLYWEHSGNKMYRQMIKDCIPKYSKAGGRLEKSLIVSQIIEKIQCTGTSNRGGFVKRTADGLSWEECSNSFVREKIGQSIRDSLHGRYKSSTMAKKRRCKELKNKLSTDLESIVYKRKYVNDVMEAVSKRMKIEKPTADEHYDSIFFQANSKLLESLKKDQTLLEEYRLISK